MQNESLMTKITSKLQPKIKFDIAAGPFPKPKMVISQPSIKISHQNLACITKTEAGSLSRK